MRLINLRFWTTPYRRILILGDHNRRTRRFCRPPQSTPRTSNVEFIPLVPAARRAYTVSVDLEDHCCAEARATLDAGVTRPGSCNSISVAGIVGAHEPFAAVQTALNLGVAARYTVYRVLLASVVTTRTCAIPC